MNDEPLYALHHPVAIDTHGPGVEREMPLPEQQAAADDVFTDAEGRFVAALMTLQTGVTAVQLIADNVRTAPEEPRLPPRRRLDEVDKD